MNKFTNIKAEGTESDSPSITGKVRALNRFDSSFQQADNDRNIDQRGTF